MTGLMTALDFPVANGKHNLQCPIADGRQNYLKVSNTLLICWRAIFN